MTQPWCVYSDEYIVDMGPHVFPVEKYRLTYQRLVEEGTLAEGDVLEPEPGTEEDVLLVHTPAYLAHLPLKRSASSNMSLRPGARTPRNHNIGKYNVMPGTRRSKLRYPSSSRVW